MTADVQPLDRDDGLDGLADERKHAARSGVENDRFVATQEVLVEREASRHGAGR